MNADGRLLVQLAPPLLVGGLLAIRHPAAYLAAVAVMGYSVGAALLAKEDSLEEVLLASPGIGMAVLVLFAYSMSAVGIPLSYLPRAVVLLTVVASLTGRIPRGKPDSSLLLVGLASFMEFAVKRFYFLLPDYRAADTWFHASKVRAIMDASSLSIQNVPPYFSGGIVKYPSGYHVIVAFLSAGKPLNIIYAMNALRLFTWAYLPVATYLLLKVLIDRRAALIGAFIVPFSALYYYFIQYALLPCFLNYLIFLFALFFLFTSDRGRGSGIVLSLLSAAMLLVHPYQFLLFEFLAGVYLLVRGREALSPVIGQAVFSFLFYYATMPYAARYIHGGIGMNPSYSNKDNPSFLIWILKFSFLDNGQFSLGAFFLAGTAVYLTRRKLLPIIGAVAFVFFMILDKIYLHITIPYYSAVWNSERYFILLTPLIPVVEAAGVLAVVELVGRRVKSPNWWRVTAAFLLIIALIPAFRPIMIEHLANESAYLLDDGVVDSLIHVSSIAGSSPVATACVFDSGRWLPVLTDTPISCLADNSGIKAGRVKLLLSGRLGKYLYLDTRGGAEIMPYPLNLEKFYSRYRLIYFKNGVWLFNTSDGDSSRNIELVRDYYAVNDSIDGSRPGSERYFVYGWTIKNPVTQKARLLGSPYIPTVWNESVVAFVPEKDFSGCRILLSAPAGRAIDIYLNGRFIGKFVSPENYTPEWVRLHCPVKAGELNFLTFRVHLKENEALGVAYIRFSGG